jgi:hypothetical protein
MQPWIAAAPSLAHAWPHVFSVVDGADGAVEVSVRRTAEPRQMFHRIIADAAMSCTGARQQLASALGRWVRAIRMKSIM